MTQTKTHISEVRTVAVPVTDQDRALEYYVETLGLEKRMDVPFGAGMRWIEVAPSGASTSIALAPTPEGAPTGVDTGIRLATHDAESAHAELQARGVDVDPDIMHWPGAPPMFNFRDPDGNRLVIVETM